MELALGWVAPYKVASEDQSETYASLLPPGDGEPGGSQCGPSLGFGRAGQDTSQ